MLAAAQGALLHPLRSSGPGLTRTGFLGRKHGLVLDRIVEHEVVLANGTVTTASKSKHPDLFFALRGAGGSFGIVTRYTFKTVPAPVTLTYSTCQSATLTTLADAFRPMVEDFCRRRYERHLSLPAMGPD